MGASGESGAGKSDRCHLVFIYSCVAAIVVGAAVGFTYMADSVKTPLYSATITAVAGLDLETDLRQQAGTLSPVFNLTVGVASHARWGRAHIGPGTSVKVSYSNLRLPMATGHVPEARVGPRESRVLPSVVASGRDVVVPGFLMDSLAEEMRSGEAMFEVKLIESHENGWEDVAQGWGRVGDTISL